MAPLAPRSAAIIGLGTIGGSLALALTRAGWNVRADANNPADRLAAARDGIRVTNGPEQERLAATVAGAEIVVICVPPTSLAHVAAKVVAMVPATVPVLHTCGIQSPRALGLPPAVFRRVTGTHPLAGAVGHGFASARPGLFGGCMISVAVPAPLQVRSAATAVWKAAGAREIMACPADEHDDRMRYVSHLPQLAATALAASLADAGIPAGSLGPGGRDTTRLAASAWPLWHALLATNHRASAAPLRLLEAELASLREALERGDFDTVGRTWKRAQAWRAAVATTASGATNSSTPQTALKAAIIRQDPPADRRQPAVEPVTLAAERRNAASDRRLAAAAKRKAAASRKPIATRKSIAKGKPTAKRRPAAKPTTKPTAKRSTKPKPAHKRRGRRA